MTSSPLLAVVFAAAAVLSLGASAVLIARLERLGTRLGMSAAPLGLVAALAADTPKVTSAVLAPYVVVSAVHPSGRPSLPRSARLAHRGSRPGRAGTVSGGLSRKGRPGDADTGALALGVVPAANVAMERSVSTPGARFAVPGVITGAIVLAQ
jgi:hypothetical protein